MNVSVFYKQPGHTAEQLKSLEKSLQTIDKTLN